MDPALLEEGQMCDAARGLPERQALCRRNELQALDLAITAFMSSLAFISMIGGVYKLKRNTLSLRNTVWCAVYIHSSMRLRSRPSCCSRQFHHSWLALHLLL